MPSTIKELLAEANAAVPRLSPDQARARLGGNMLIVDVRDPSEGRRAARSRAR